MVWTSNEVQKDCQGAAIGCAINFGSCDAAIHLSACHWHREPTKHMEAPCWRLLRALQFACPKCLYHGWRAKSSSSMHDVSIASLHKCPWQRRVKVWIHTQNSSWRRLRATSPSESVAVVSRCWQGNLGLEIATVVIPPALFMLPSASCTRCLCNHNPLSFANRL